MKELFYVERLADSPEKIYYLLMAKDKFNKYIQDRTVTNYGLDCSGNWPRHYCRRGLILTNSIHYLHKADNSDFDAWYVHNLKANKVFI